MSQEGNTLPRRDALKPVKGTPKYLTGYVAMDICRLTGLSLDDSGKFIDMSRLDWWEQWRVLWAFVGGNYYAVRNPWPEPKRNQCTGCQADWSVSLTDHGFPIHSAPDGGIVGCTQGVHT